MKTSDIINEFLDKRFDIKASNMHSEEDKLYNYSTVIAQWFDDTLLINITKYSNTTSRNQNDLVKGADKRNIKYYTVVNIPMGTKDLNYIYNG